MVIPMTYGLKLGVPVRIISIITGKIRIYRHFIGVCHNSRIVGRFHSSLYFEGIYSSFYKLGYMLDSTGIAACHNEGFTVYLLDRHLAVGTLLLLYLIAANGIVPPARLGAHTAIGISSHHVT